jgi:polyhydroxyalkanoate synthesis regulator phasin
MSDLDSPSRDEFWDLHNRVEDLEQKVRDLQAKVAHLTGEDR